MGKKFEFAPKFKEIWKRGRSNRLTLLISEKGLSPLVLYLKYPCQLNFSLNQGSFFFKQNLGFGAKSDLTSTNFFGLFIEGNKSKGDLGKINFLDSAKLVRRRKGFGERRKIVLWEKSSSEAMDTSDGPHEVQCIFSLEDGGCGEEGQGGDVNLIYISKDWPFQVFVQNIAVLLGLDIRCLEFKYSHPTLTNIRVRVGCDMTYGSMMKCHGDNPCRVFVRQRAGGSNIVMVEQPRCVKKFNFVGNYIGIYVFCCIKCVCVFIMHD